MNYSINIGCTVAVGTARSLSLYNIQHLGDLTVLFRMDVYSA